MKQRYMEFCKRQATDLPKDFDGTETQEEIDAVKMYEQLAARLEFQNFRAT